MCENCPMPGSGGYCCVCQDTPEVNPVPLAGLDPLEGERLYALGLTAATEGRSLASTIHSVQVQWGPLALVQLQDLIRGWTEGATDAQSYAEDMTSLADLDSDPGPF